MNLLFLFHFVFYQTAFGLVIGSPNLPVLGDGDVSGIFETNNLVLQIICNLQVWESQALGEHFSSAISYYKIFS